MSNLRRLIADHMVRSAHTAAPVTLATEADATELVRIREAFQSEPLAKILPSYNALFAKLVSIALVEFPIMNSSLDGDEIIFWERVHIGIAVETERGLVVPVIHDVDLKPLRALVVEVDELLARAAQGKALPDELASGTFTITNLGVFDIDMFTPIINEPQCAILGVGRLVRKVVPINDQVATRTMVNLSLTFDHRLVDGAPAARFMKRVKQFIEQPYLWLI